MGASLYLGTLATGCLAGTPDEEIRVLEASVLDALGGRWSPDDAPRVATIALQITPKGASLAGRVAWLTGDADPALLLDLADPPLRKATKQRLLPFSLESTRAGVTLHADQVGQPGAQSTVVVWQGGDDPQHAWWRQRVLVSRSPAAGARLVASLPAAGSTVSTATRRALLQWDGSLEGLEDAVGHLTGPDGTHQPSVEPGDCAKEGLPQGSCVWLSLPALQADASYTLALTAKALRASTGDSVEALEMIFHTGADTPSPATSRLPCDPDEVPLAGGCGRATREGVRLRVATLLPALVSLGDGQRVRSRLTTSEAVEIALPLGGPSDLTLRVRDLTGRVHTEHLRAAPEPALPQISFREVLASPHGSDAHTEYVEVVNDGDQAITMQGWELSRDPARVGARVARAAVLAPGSAALLVGPQFDPEVFVDLPQGLVRAALDRALSLPASGSSLTLRDQRGRRVADAFVAATAAGRCSQFEPDGRRVTGACRYTEVAGRPPPPPAGSAP